MQEHIYKHKLEFYISANEGAVDCTADWSAKKAVRNKLGTHYVRYDNAILEFGDNDDIYLSKEQINIILENLELR